MQFLIILIATILAGPVETGRSFREEQMVYTRVKEAYSAKEKTVNQNLIEHHLLRDSLRIYLRVFKTERKMELWGKNKSDSTYLLLKEFSICDISGTIGPKRCLHDLQVPEGFYHITSLNPYSKYYLSMKLNYPNASDSIRGEQGRLGYLIYIHGGCASSGCIAITDDQIKELVVYSIEACNSGQQEIDVTIYPARLSDSKYAGLTTKYKTDSDKISLWADLKKSYDLFENTKIPPAVKFLPDGTHEIN